MTECTLGDLVALQRGNTYKGALLGLPGPVLLGLGSIERDGGFKGSKLKTYGGTSDPRMLLAPGDVFVSLKDVTQAGDLLGAVARVPPHISIGRLTQDTVKLVPKSKSVSLDLIYWTLRTPQYRTFCRSHATGTTNLGLPREDFLSFPIPDLTEELSNLVGLLQSLDDKVDQNRRMNETLEAMARALFRDWFIDFGPTRAKMAGQAPNLSPALWDHFPASIDDEGKPDGWKVKPLSDAFHLLMGQSPPGETYNDEGDGLAFFQGRTDFGFRFPENRKYCSAPTRVAEKGDTLVSVRAPVGDINIAAERCCIGRGVAALRHKEDRTSFTYYTAWALQEELRQYENTGTVFGAINRKQFEALPTVDPGSDLLKAFEETASAMDQQIKRNERETRTLAQTRDLLWPRLMSDELRVANVADEVAP